jgi:uncharacterized protein (DUF169 family)
MTKDELIRTIKEDLKVKKEILAVKAMKETPKDIPPYEGQATPGMCALVGEILNDGSVWYVIKANFGCFEALTATGTCENLPWAEYVKFMQEENELYPMHKDAATVEEYYTKINAFFKHPKVEGSGIVVGPLAKVENPDLVMLFVTPHQADILNRVRGYFGDFTRGFGGLGGCIFTMRYSFMTKEPSFSLSDTAWRMFSGLNYDELTYTFPYQKLLAIAERIKPTAEYVDSFLTMFKTE